MRPAVIKRLHARIAAIPAEEIGRQCKILTEGQISRELLTILVYFISALMAPPSIVSICATVDFTAKWISFRQMKGLVPANNPLRYLGTLTSVVLSQGCYALSLAHVYQSPLPLAMPFATGCLSMALFQLTTIRVVHRPYAIVGFGATFAAALWGVVMESLNRSGSVALVLSVIALIAAAYFIYTILHSNHVLHAQVVRERETARAAERTKAKFLARMSHELRTPLNAILGLSHSEMVQAKDPVSVERMRNVTDAARGLAVILDEILDMSAIEAGHLPIRPTPCIPAREIKTAAELYRPLFEARGLHFILEVSPDLSIQVLLDGQRLRQCLSNLLSNALKYTPSGGVTLQAGLGSDGRIQIAVSDTGLGIPLEEADRIFQPFQRGASTQPGTGLGLPISRAIARVMGGDLELVAGGAGGGVGARFLLTIGCAVDAAAATTTVPTSPPLPQTTTPIRVLIVDDIATNRLVARIHLQLLGAATEEAASGEEALELIRNNPPDLVFLDMNMPGLDGLDTLRLIRKLPTRAARVAVVAMTADATDAHRRRYLDAGLDGYLAKPLTPESVSEIVARFAPRA